MNDSDMIIGRKPTPEEIEAERAKEQLNIDNLHNKSFSLTDFLLYFVFSEGSPNRVRDLALKVLIKNFKQREMFVNEIVKIELIISEEDLKDYGDIKY